MNKYGTIIVLFLLISGSCSAQTNSSKQYVFEVSDVDEDFTPKVFDALNNKDLACTLEFRPGTYNFYPEKAYEKYVKISNNDNGLRKFIFALEGRKNITINGNGATFLFHGSCC